MKNYERLSESDKKKIKKSFTKEEVLACELIWGGVPLDVDFVKNSPLFISKLAEINLYQSRH
jgi:hypothetical protein